MELSLNEERAHNGKMSKIDRYNWTIQDTPGEMKFIHKASIEIDHSYQRNANETKLTAIARDWSWIACGAIVVAE